MERKYILLLGEELTSSEWLEPVLHAQGLRSELHSRHARLFVSAATPLLRLPSGGVLIGRIFDRQGNAVVDASGFNGTADECEHRLLSDTWGEYLAVHMADNDEGHMVRLLRDPSGAVPCLHRFKGGSGFATSDIVLATHLGIHRKEVDWQAMAHGLAFPYLRTGRTTLKHVRELLPGSTLVCHGDEVSAHAAWSPWNLVSKGVRHVDRDAAIADVRTAVSAAVAALSASDRRLVVELSGGLDSSIVAACLAGDAARATFCTLVMPVTGTDERPYARLVTDALGCSLTTQKVGFENVRFDFPLSPSAVVPAMGILQNAVNDAWEEAGTGCDADSYLSGGGGDTVFCYLKTAAPAADAFRENGPVAGLTAVRDLSALHQCTFWKAMRLTLRKLHNPPSGTWRKDSRFLSPTHTPDTPDHHPWLDMPAGALPGDREKIQDLVGTQLFRDTAPRSAGRSMHFPLLTQPVMEACLRVPTWMWIDGGRNRAVARDAFADQLPRGILERRSKGSYTGYMAAVYTRNKHGMRRFLGEGQLAAHDLLDCRALADFLDRELAPRDLSFLRIFDLCAAENWARQQA